MEELIKLYIQKAKLYLIPLILVLVAFVILMYITVPQFNSIGELQQQINAKKTEVEQNIETKQALEEIPDADLTENVKIAKHALPDSKDLISIYSTLSSIALKSGATISAFSIKVGDVFSSRENAKLSEERSTSGSPVLSIRLNVEATDYRNLVTFSENLYKSLPLAEIKTLRISPESGTFDVVFFYKTFDPKQLVRQEQVRPLTASEQNNLKKITEWENN